MAKIMNDNFQINVGNPIDSKYLNSSNQPYANSAAVLAAIPESQRYIGLTVNVANVEYWFYNGVADGNFMIKDSGLASTGITAAYNGLTKVANAVKLGGTLTGNTTINEAGYSLKFNNGQVISSGATGQGFDSYNAYKLSGNTILSVPTRNYANANLAVGHRVLTGVTTGTFNVGVGYDVLNKVTTGDFNFAMGNCVLSNNTSGSQNSGIGTYVLRANTIGEYNNGFGTNALVGNITGGSNNAFGASALCKNTYGDSNNAYGASALFSNTTGSRNVAFGDSALYDNTTACRNTAIGTNALTYNTTGKFGTALGADTAYCNTTGSGTTAIGRGALYLNQTGCNNVALGLCAGYTATTSNKLYIANTAACNLIYGDFVVNEVTLPKVKLCTTPATGVSTDGFLVWNSTDKCVKQVNVGSIIAGSITGATNGLTKVNQQVKLGGTLTGNTKICLNGKDFCVSCVGNIYFFPSGGTFQACALNSYVYGTSCASLWAAAKSVDINSSGVRIIGTTCLDTIPNGGSLSDVVLVRNTAQGEIRCIPISDITGATHITANNGLTKQGTNIKLGGKLTGNTTIDSGNIATGHTLMLGDAVDYSNIITLKDAFYDNGISIFGQCTLYNVAANYATSGYSQMMFRTNNDSYWWQQSSADSKLSLYANKISDGPSGAWDAFYVDGTNNKICAVSRSGCTYVSVENACVDIKGCTKLQTTPSVGTTSDSVLVRDGSGLVKTLSVASITGATVVNATNGLTKSANTIKLGGSLCEVTTITASTHTNCLLINAPTCICDTHVIGFHCDPTVTGWKEGRLYYQNNNLNFEREYSGVTLQIGEEQVIKVVNQTGSLIPNGAAVYITGATGTYPRIAKAIANNASIAENTLGMTTMDIADNSEGYVTIQGLVRSLNTSTFPAGSRVYLSPTIAGCVTTTEPVYPNSAIHIGYVICQSASVGSVLVQVDNETPYTSIGTFNAYTASTQSSLNNKLACSVFNTYTGNTATCIAYLDNVADKAVTGATNGLTCVATRNVCLGGTLSAPVTISGTQLLTLGDLNGVCLSTANTNDIALNAKSNGAIYLKSQSGTVASSSDATNAVVIAIDYNASPAMFITDSTASPHGLVYANDYSATYCLHSLVDKYYVDSVATGLNVHGAVAVTTVSGITMSGLTQTIDGIPVNTTGMRVLVKNQTNQTTNGIYSASTGTWGRTADYNFAPSGEVSNGDLIPVLSGNTNANSQWILVSPNPIVSGTTNLVYSKFSQQQGVVEGPGICVTTVGANREVCVKLSPSNSGLCFDASALEIDYNIFRVGLTCSVTTGKVDVRATVGSASGTEIGVRINTGGTNVLYVDSSAVATALGTPVTTANNGLCKQGSNVRLGGALTGDTTIDGVGGAFDLNLTSLDSFNLSFDNVSTITDNGTNGGLRYALNYGGNFVDRSLVDKYYVNNAITGTTLTYNNGLTKQGKVISWGGTLTGNTFVSYGADRLCFVCSAGVSCIDVLSDCSKVHVQDTSMCLQSCTNGTCLGTICLDSTGNIKLSSNNATLPICITAPQAMKYASDYSATFTARSIPDAAWVTGKTTTAGLQTACNGLTKVGSQVKLGGALTGNTCIGVGNNPGGYRLVLSGNTFNGVPQGICVIPENTFIGNLNSGNVGSGYGCMTVGVSNADIYYEPSNGRQCVAFSISCNSPLSMYRMVSATTNCTYTHFDLCDRSLPLSVVNFCNNDCSKITLCEGAIDIFGVSTTGFKGAQYASGTYRANFVCNSLVDAAWVTGKTSQGIATANNGLTKQGQNVKLGGALTGDTSVGLNSKFLRISGATTCNTFNQTATEINILNEAAYACFSKTGGNGSIVLSVGTGGTAVDISQSGDRVSMYTSGGGTLDLCQDKQFVVGTVCCVDMSTTNGNYLYLGDVGGNDCAELSAQGLAMVSLDGTLSLMCLTGCINVCTPPAPTTGFEDVLLRDTITGEVRIIPITTLTGATAVTFDNGLTNTAGVVCLGGVLTQLGTALDLNANIFTVCYSDTSSALYIGEGNDQITLSTQSTFSPITKLDMVGAGNNVIELSVACSGPLTGTRFSICDNGGTPTVFLGINTGTGPSLCIDGGPTNGIILKAGGATAPNLSLDAGNDVASLSNAAGNQQVQIDTNGIHLFGTINVEDIPASGDTTMKILVRDPASNGEVKAISASLISGAITANNGLNKAGNNIRLGGALTGNTTIGNNTCTLNIKVNTFNLTGSTAVSLNTTSNPININAGASCVNISGSVKLQSTPVTGAVSDSILVWNSIDKTVKAVAGTSLGAITGATNGLSKVAQRVVLGGTLSGGTTNIYGGTSSALVTCFGNANCYAYVCQTAGGGTPQWVSSMQNQTVGYATTIQHNVNMYEIFSESGATGSCLALVAGIAGYAQLKSSTCVVLDAPQVKLIQTPPAGLTSDSVLVWNSSDKRIKTVSGAALGDKNNVYAKTIVSANATGTTASTYVQLISGATSYTLPSAPMAGQAFKIKDAAGTALSTPIVINAGAGKVIDGAQCALINTDYGALELVYGATNKWFSLAFVN